MQPLLDALLKRRRGRVHAWLEQQTQRFKGSPEATNLEEALVSAMLRIEAAFSLCTASCASCYLPCVALGHAHQEHSCGTDHMCHNVCQFCTEAVEPVNYCKDKAGHMGRHMCNVVQHACGEVCALAGKALLNCRGTCRKDPGHDGDCDCLSGNHMCGQICSLERCAGPCVVPYGTEHDRHACGDNMCLEVRLFGTCLL